MGMFSFYGPTRPKEEIVELIRYVMEQLGVTLLDTSDTYGPFTNKVLISKVNNTCKPVALQTIIVLKASPTVISM
jgi:aryl-alcohol dehydrogenase-like predicted oxidoreductase